MPAEATVSVLKLWAGTHGATFQQDADKEIRRMRSRLAAGSSAQSTRLLGKCFVYGMEPAISAISAGTAVFRKSEASHLGESVYDAACGAPDASQQAVCPADGFRQRMEAGGVGDSPRVRGRRCSKSILCGAGRGEFRFTAAPSIVGPLIFQYELFFFF